jgi:hypothetical protein
MIYSDLKNTIDLIKNINGLQLNFNNQNLTFKQYSRNSKYITFTNQSGLDINVPLDELNNQYKKKYTISNESSVDTSIFNSKNKTLVGGNDDISSTSASFISKINNDNIRNSLTSDSSLISNLSKTSVFLQGGNNEEFSATSFEEASAFETESLSTFKGEELLGGNYDDNLEGGGEEINNTFMTINLEEIRNNLRNDRLTSDTVNYQSSSTLNSLTEFKDMSNQVSDTAVINKLLQQTGGGNNLFVNNNKIYNINSSSTSSVCE